VYQVGKEIKRI